MIRSYCDGCGEELTEPMDMRRTLTYHSDGIPISEDDSWPLRPVRVTVTISDGIWARELCRTCIARVVSYGKREQVTR